MSDDEKPDEICAKCGNARANHRYRHPFVAAAIGARVGAATKIFTGIKELVSEEVDELRADTRRLDWLEKNPDELEWVRGRVNNEGGTVREAIDWFIARRAQKDD